MDKYQLTKKSSKFKLKPRVDSWRKIEKYLNKHESATFDELALLCSNHRHSEGCEGFIKRCISFNWLEETNDTFSLTEIKRKSSAAWKDAKTKWSPHIETTAHKAKEMLKNVPVSLKKKTQKPNKEKIMESVRKTGYSDDLIEKDQSGIDDRERVRRTIKLYSLICAGVAIQPLPFADILILTPIQILMGARISKIRKLNYSKADIKRTLTEIVGIIGMGYVAQQGIIAAYKTFIPYYGAITTIPVVFAFTYAMGRIFDLYCLKKASGGVIDKNFKEQAKQIFVMYKIAFVEKQNEIIDLVRKKEKSASDLNRDDGEMLAEEQEKAIFEGLVEDIYGTDAHHDFLLEAICECNEKIFVFAPWISSNVIDEHLVRLIESEILSKNKHIFLFWGYKDKQKPKPKNIAAKNSLLKLHEKFPSNLHLAEIPSHIKNLILDDKYYVKGSHNWLSNRWGSNWEHSQKFNVKILAEKEADLALRIYNKFRIPDNSVR